MREVASNVFTRSPGQFLEAVTRGETILVTRYGRPYVQLSPPAQPDPPAPEKAAKGSR